MRISGISTSVLPNYRQNANKKVSFGEKDLQVEHEKHQYSVDSEIEALAGNKDIAIWNILKIKKALFEQVNNNWNRLTTYERLGLLIDFLDLDKEHGFCWKADAGNEWQRYAYQPREIAETAQKLHKENYSVDNLSEPYKSMAQVYSRHLGKWGTIYMSDDPVGEKASKQVKRYIPAMHMLDEQIDKIAEEQGRGENLSRRISDLKRLMVMQVNNTSNTLTEKERLGITIQLACVDKVFGWMVGRLKNETSMYGRTLIGPELDDLTTKNYGIDDLLEPYKSFAKVFLDDKRINKPHRDFGYGCEAEKLKR